MRKPRLETLTFERLSFPEDVIVETYAHCNLRCIMCPYRFVNRPKGEMDLAVFAKIVDEIALENPLARLWVAILGEPLLGRNLLPMLRYARDRGIKRINLNTNATFLTPEMTGELLDAGVDHLLVSLDAHTCETYDQIRVGGDFQTTVNNVNFFLEERHRRGLSKPGVIAQFIVMDENAQEVEDFKEYWLERGAIVKIRLKMGWGNVIPTEDLTKANVQRNFPCPWLLRAVSIHWDGRFAQCDADWDAEYSPGDIRIQTIKQVWSGEIASRIRQHRALDFSFAPCETCRDWSVGRAQFYYPEKSE
jgi:sulfatase maturation enzyme AslB (radical SAM superfamily)